MRLVLPNATAGFTPARLSRRIRKVTFRLTGPNATWQQKNSFGAHPCVSSYWTATP
ncbi:hypothetical protein DA2_0228 [Desulfovibrio sp. A2]|nr:hypothetical protein DA2_0228 [Desulfovibrio sp. A2]